MRDPLRPVLVGLLRAYRAVVSPLYGQVCRYHPSCSAYALEAVTVHGSVRGSWLAVRRLGRCHPWAAGGYDPVPGSDRPGTMESSTLESRTDLSAHLGQDTSRAPSPTAPGLPAAHPLHVRPTRGV